MSYWKCEACTALTKTELGNCWNCGSERSAEATVYEDTASDAMDAVASERRRPRLGHVLPSILVFVLAGPLVGLFASMFEHIGHRNFISILPFAVIGAYTIGGLPAALAGLLYATSSTAVVIATPTLNVRCLLGATLGVCVSLLAVSASMHLMVSVPAIREMRIAEFSSLGAIAGALCGAVSGWLFPIGRRKTAERARGDA